MVKFGLLPAKMEGNVHWPVSLSAKTRQFLWLWLPNL